MPPWKVIPWSVGPSLECTWPTCCHHSALWNAGLYLYPQDPHLPRDPVAVAVIPDYNLLQSGSWLSWHWTRNTDWTFDCFAFGDIELILRVWFSICYWNIGPENWDLNFPSEENGFITRSVQPLFKYEEGSLRVFVAVQRLRQLLKSSIVVELSPIRKTFSCFLIRMDLRELWGYKLYVHS